MADLQPVDPGDLITAETMNELITAVENLSGRVSDLEDRVQELEDETEQVKGPFANLPGVNFADAIRLRTEGIRNLEDFTAAGSGTISGALEMEESDAQSLISAAENLLGR